MSFLLSKVKNKILHVFRQSPLIGRWILYLDPKKYWEKRGGETYFGEQESRIDRTVTSEFIADEICLLGGETILEVGCDYGKILRDLRKRTHAQLYGIDFSSSQLKKAVDYLEGLDNILLLKGNAVSLPFLDKSIDIVFTSNVILHNPPRIADRIRKEILRVAKKYVVHKEDVDVNFSRYGYDHAKIYQKMNLRVLRSEKVESAVDKELTQFTIVQK